MAPHHFHLEDEQGDSPWIQSARSVAGQESTEEDSGPRAVLFVSAGSEYADLAARLGHLDEMLYRGHVYEHGNWRTEQKVWEVLIFEVESEASVFSFVSRRIVSHFQPDLVFVLADTVGTQGTEAMAGEPGEQETSFATPRLAKSAEQVLAELEQHDRQRVVDRAFSQEPARVAGTLEIFYSYAPEDEIWLERLSKHLIMLRRSGQISEWYERKLAPGASRQEHLRHLESAQIILLLVSVDYLASNYCYQVEAGRAMQRHHNGQATVIPILLRPVHDLSETLFGELQSLPKDGSAVAVSGDPDGVLQELAREISALVKLNRNKV